MGAGQVTATRGDCHPSVLTAHLECVHRIHSTQRNMLAKLLGYGRLHARGGGGDEEGVGGDEEGVEVGRVGIWIAGY